jgi:protoporphyrinogen oxidase
MKSDKLVIIGAGPAGLTAAYELQELGIKNIIVIEADILVGGISKTINYKGNRIDIGGHRFFSKSDWVMKWWLKMLPLSNTKNYKNLELSYKGMNQKINFKAEKKKKENMLLRSRLSRIYFNRQFFDYPLKLNLSTLIKLGPYKVLTFGLSYMIYRFFPIKPENNFENFLINRFGKKLYLQFFKEYTEKVWGVKCSEISAEWGAQRIKALSITKALIHSIKKALNLNCEKNTNTSLIESFIYPKFGPGQMWETVLKKIKSRGAEIYMESKVIEIKIVKDEVKSITFIDKKNKKQKINTSNVISSMPIKDLIESSADFWSVKVLNISKKLQYRDFITVGLLYNKNDLVDNLNDNWIYIQEPGVNVGRVQIFNNWSPFMVAKPNTIWLGLEFFCKTTDHLWKKSEDSLKLLAQSEMRKIGLANCDKSLDAVVIKVPKAYPGYFGNSYKKFNLIREAVDKVNNLFLVGRNGMHRYNNQDHSMLTAKEAALQIATGIINKNKIWNINVGDDYHEEK